MTKRLVVITDDASKADRQAITDAIKGAGVAWWHWFQPAWLIKDRQDRSTKWWRDLLTKAADTHLLILEVSDEADWSGLGKKSHFAWMHTTWDES